VGFEPQFQSFQDKKSNNRESRSLINTFPRVAREAGSESQDTLPSVHRLLSTTSFSPPEKSTEEADLFDGGILESLILDTFGSPDATGFPAIELFSRGFGSATFRALSLNLLTAP